MDRIITVDQLIEEIKKYDHVELHIHHTFAPSHKDWNGHNGLTLQQGMRNYHMTKKKWSDIGQHVTLLPDGMFVTGRPFNETPASIYGHNRGAFAVEMLGDFDSGHDILTGEQKESILKLARFFVDKGKYIRFHRENAPWKSCPGTGIDKDTFMKEVKTFQSKPISVPAKETVQILKRGSRGEDVKKLQNKLNSLGFNCGTVDGVFGLKTELAVRALQKASGILIDGIVGPNTMKALNSYVDLPNIVLSLGSRGDNVAKVQIALNSLGFNCGAADGIFGPKTKAALISFQNKYGLVKDGIYGPKTRQKLIEVRRG
ncbi:N-acetylmuramoyl-L-alanine amidase [Tepidibacillus sp. LV47]|uniref:peptidoglycan recognition protein family protein n=1 Tax=Tepidibacillus sp. LV47 TaxID=3398228 RepID=UPI003AAB4DBD